MQLYLRIHDKRENGYKNSCELPIFNLSINEDNNVVAVFKQPDKEYIKACISKLDNISITEFYIQFNLKDYHFTSYIV